MKVCVVFGGSGYIGTYLIKSFLVSNSFDRIYVCDIRKSKVSDDFVTHVECDVRKKIIIQLPASIDGSKSWVFNFAAIHREPGHEAHEYFDTNIQGAKNINVFLDVSGISNLYFTSSIAPYGPSKKIRDESSQCYPETPYGISKWKAESIHEVWQKKNPNHRLIISRPSVIYGPGDPGNVLRMINGIIKGTFFIPGDPAIIKSHGYIYGFIDSVIFTMGKNEKYILYNYAENPCLSLSQMCCEVKKVFGIKRRTYSVPLRLLVVASMFITFFNRRSSVHPVRVKKAAFPTNILPGYLIRNDFHFKYEFSKSLPHWLSLSPDDFN